MWCCRARDLRKRRLSAEGEGNSDKLRASGKRSVVVVRSWLAARLKSRCQWI